MIITTLTVNHEVRLAEQSGLYNKEVIAVLGAAPIYPASTQGIVDKVEKFKAGQESTLPYVDDEGSTNP